MTPIEIIAVVAIGAALALLVRSAVRWYEGRKAHAVLDRGNKLLDAYEQRQRERQVQAYTDRLDQSVRLDQRAQKRNRYGQQTGGSNTSARRAYNTDRARNSDDPLFFAGTFSDYIIEREYDIDDSFVGGGGSGGGGGSSGSWDSTVSHANNSSPYSSGDSDSSVGGGDGGGD